MRVPQRSSWTVRQDRPSAGFTLLEEILVIATLVILLVLLLPALSMLRALGVRTTCQANLRAIGTAAASYAMNHNFALPTHYADPTIPFDTFRMRRDDGAFVNLGTLLNYVDSPKAFYCASQNARTSPSIAYDSPENRWHDAGTGPGGAGNGGASEPRPGLNASYSARFRTLDDPHRPNWTAANHANKVTYSDFIGVDDWPGRGHFQKQLRSPHRSQGYNRLFGDGSVLWTDAVAVNALRPVTAVEPTADELLQYWRLLDVLR